VAKYPPSATEPGVIYASPEEVEKAFYEAVERQDINALMSLWSNDEEIVCIHPNGQRVSGVEEVRKSFAQAMEDPPVRIAKSQQARWEGAVMALYQNIETVLNKETGQPGGVPLFVSHIFMLGAHGWRMVCRHSTSTTTGKKSAGVKSPPVPNGAGDHTLH